MTKEIDAGARAYALFKLRGSIMLVPIFFGQYMV